MKNEKKNIYFSFFFCLQNCHYYFDTSYILRNYDINIVSSNKINGFLFILMEMF